MATFEEFIIAEQLKQYIRNGVINWRQEAANYKVRAALGGANFVAIGQIMKEDAAQHENLMLRITALASRNLAMLDAALMTMGITRAAAIVLRDLIIATADHVQAATLTTQAQINTESDFILASLPAYDSVN